MEIRKWIGLVICCAGLLAACAPPPCSLQNKSQFVESVKQTVQSFDAMEFNVAYTTETKTIELKKIRDQANGIVAPECAQYLKVLLNQSLDERLKNIGNPDNKIRPSTGVFLNEFKAFENASIAQLTDVANSQPNNTGFLQVIILMGGMLVVILLGFGGYFFYRRDHAVPFR